jgi:uncharacterized protein
MEFSKHNILSRIADSDRYFIVNPLSGNADILEAHEVQAIQKGDATNQQELVKKGYLVDTAEEEQLFKRKYLDFLDERENDEIQIFFAPWYTCNFSCSYCFQDEYRNPKTSTIAEVVDAFFRYVDKRFASRRKYLTLFGGEPLLNSPSRRQAIAQFLESARERDLDVAIVTNGYHIVDFIDIFKASRIREVQVTLDGPKNIHDARRMLHGGAGSFERITEGIDALLGNGIPVNLRVIVDKENIEHLVELARFAIRKTWTANPLFKTALGRNYELHHCQTNSKRLFSRIEMYEKVYELIKNNPEILAFHKPAFSISKFIFENGKLPNPLFDSCPGTKTEWAFDYTGRIYSCTATVGNEGDELGTFHPREALDEASVEEWEDRDVLSIKECTTCNLRLACGGGCAAVARTGAGKIQSPDCRPITELLELGMGLYASDD